MARLTVNSRYLIVPDTTTPRYRALVYLGDGGYDVVVTVHSNVICMTRDRTLVYSTECTSDKKKTCAQLLPYIREKLIGADPAERKRGIFTRVRMSLPWIRGVLRVEMDYHLGARVCTRPEYKSELDKYKKNYAIGFDPEGYSAKCKGIREYVNNAPCL